MILRALYTRKVIDALAKTATSNTNDGRCAYALRINGIDTRAAYCQYSQSKSERPARRALNTCLHYMDETKAARIAGHLIDARYTGGAGWNYFDALYSFAYSARPTPRQHRVGRPGAALRGTYCARHTAASRSARPSSAQLLRLTAYQFSALTPRRRPLPYHFCLL